jgi:L-asparaginase / beta-aspartyl-peptidase
MDTGYSLMVHGGAGVLSAADDPLRAECYLESLRGVLEQGRVLLAGGGSALDAIELCCALLEDDPLFNAGRGSVLNADGAVEMDAGIMDGRTLAAGAVAAVRRIANPIRLARQVLESGDALLLVGEGAQRFAARCDIAEVPESYLITPGRQDEWARVRATDVPVGATEESGSGSAGTVGAVARDGRGHLAAATSTGGRVNKPVGRVGDSPLIGAGVYAEDRTCAVSATGDGEALMRVLLAKTISSAIEHRGLNAEAAVEVGMQTLRGRLSGAGGAICIDHRGHCAAGRTTPRMPHGWIERGGPVQCRL